MQNDICTSSGTRNSCTTTRTMTLASSGTTPTPTATTTVTTTVTTSANLVISPSVNIVGNNEGGSVPAVPMTRKVSPPPSSFTTSPAHSNPSSPSPTSTIESAAAAIAASTLASFHSRARVQPHSQAQSQTQIQGQAQAHAQAQGLLTETDGEGSNNRKIIENKTNNTNVDQVVAKSKRAASLLWMLLHAQNCPSPPVVQNNNNKTNTNNLNNNTTSIPCPCPFKGCTEVKRLLDHAKNCPAKHNINAPCPTNYQGCQDSRKLLAHYRQCREKAKLYRKQCRIATKKSPTKHQQANFCLICTLLAKHDRKVTEQMKAKRKQQQQQQQQQRQQNYYRQQKQYLGRQKTTPFPSSGHSKTVQFDLNPQSRIISDSSSEVDTPDGNTDFSIPTSTVTTKNKSITTTTAQHNSTNGNSNNSNSNMPPPLPRSRARTSSIGSLTSLLRASSKLKNRKTAIYNRPRATSLDERVTLSTLSTIACSLEQNDPTLEFELTNPTTSTTTVFEAENFCPTTTRSSNTNIGANSSSNTMDTCSGTTGVSGMNDSAESTSFELHDGHMTSAAETLPFRKRSVSCSVVYSGPSDRQYNCETIMEE